MRFARLAMTVMALWLLVAPSAAAESKWSFKKLVPSFGKKDEPLRGLYPEPKEPSVWQKMGQGTKTTFAKTKKALPSWMMPRTQERVSRSAKSAKKSNKRLRGEVRTARRNFFSPWLPKDEPIKRPETVSDFLGQPRPE